MKLKLAGFSARRISTEITCSVQKRLLKRKVHFGKIFPNPPPPAHLPQDIRIRILGLFVFLQADILGRDRKALFKIWLPLKNHLKVEGTAQLYNGLCSNTVGKGKQKSACTLSTTTTGHKESMYIDNHYIQCIILKTKDCNMLFKTALIQRGILDAI